MKTTIISLLYKLLLRPLFFIFDPEMIHDLATFAGRILGSNQITKALTKSAFYYRHKNLSQTILNIKFTNPVGLSAGFDKDANLIDILPSVGFGFMQIGSITNDPYGGNPKPRLYRLPKSKAIVVYYGLKNIGATKIIKKVKKSRRTGDFPISISVAKTNSAKTSSTKAGVLDYYNCLRKLETAGVGDFYTINISCPNTFGGEPFTTPDKLQSLLKKISDLRISKPIFIKMPINLPWGKFKSLLDIIVKHNIQGVIIGNLNKDYKDPGIKDNIPSFIKGGISGKPTQPLSNTLISKTYKKYGNKLIIIGVGGIFSASDAYEKIKRGATLVQLITGMIYVGPQLIGDINKGLVGLMKKDGYNSIADCVGSYHK